MKARNGLDTRRQTEYGNHHPEHVAELILEEFDGCTGQALVYAAILHATKPVDELWYWDLVYEDIKKQHEG